MNRRTGAVPNAWDDDDWVSQTANKAAAETPPPAALNRQERMQQHAEANRKLWESADSPETFHYIEANTGGVSLSASNIYKPQVKVLSRKPIMTKKKDPATGLSMLSLDDDDDEARLQAGGAQLTPEEIRAKQRREREEKQKRYDEARAKIFGESAPSSRGSSPGTGTVTPPRSDGRSASARGRGRGGTFRTMSNNNANNNSGSSSSSSSNNNNNNNNNNSNSNSNNNGNGNGNGNSSNNNAGSYSFDNRRPISSMTSTRELYDPNSSPRPDSSSRGRGGSISGGENSPRVQTPKEETQQVQAIRSPRGPDSSGRGGFALARRGARET